jgi:allantoin racemase
MVHILNLDSLKNLRYFLVTKLEGYMSRRLLWINPVGFDAYDKPISDALRDEAFPDTRIDVCSLKGVKMQHLEYNVYEMVAAGPTMGAIRWGEEQGYDAAVIGCFYDPFLRAGRELTNKMAVTAPAEACLHIASTLGERISILVGRSKWIPEMHENVVKYGFEDRFASFRKLRMTVSEFQKDPVCTEDRILEEARKAVEEDGADVIVLGCTIEFGFYKKVQEELGVPVIDAIVAPLRYAELLADIRLRQNWGISNALGYETPDRAEMDAWVPIIEPNIYRDPRS